MPTTDRKLRVFLCHASQDKPLVRELYRRLLAEGWIDPWLDTNRILPGQNWRQAIEEAVEMADSVIICLSKNSVTKEGYIQKEMRYAQEISFEKPEGTIFLIPLRLEECKVPRGLRFVQWTNYFNEQKEQSYLDLLAALNLRLNEKNGRTVEPRAREENTKDMPDDREISEKGDTTTTPDTRGDDEKLTGHFEPILEKARSELSRNNIPGALENYGKLIKKGYLLADVIYDLREASYRHPVEVGIWQSLGDAYMRANKSQDALVAYTKAEQLLR